MTSGRACNSRASMPIVAAKSSAPFVSRGQLIAGVSRPLLWSSSSWGSALNPISISGRGHAKVRVCGARYLSPVHIPCRDPAQTSLHILTRRCSRRCRRSDREFIRLLGVHPGLAIAALHNFCSALFGRADRSAVQSYMVLVLCSRVSPISRLNPPFGYRAWIAIMFMLRFALTSLGVVIANRVPGFEVRRVRQCGVFLPLLFHVECHLILPLDPSLTSAQNQVVYPEWLV